MAKINQQAKTNIYSSNIKTLLEILKLVNC